ncbi:AHH domain-containing protein [Bacterioplanoides sp.]|uniref:AHH domain-containing protein n=1 Tax=Bacterioplanoides sp. TaxID=2066072 RepID=UPI003AFF68F0
MYYQVKDLNEIAWHELERIESPTRASNLVQRNSNIQLSSAVNRLVGDIYRDRKRSHVGETARNQKLINCLKSGTCFLLSPPGHTLQPVIRLQAKVNAQNTQDNASVDLDSQIILTVSDQYKNALKILLAGTPRPNMTASVSKAKAKTQEDKSSNPQSQPKPTYDLVIKAHYENAPQDIIQTLPYEVVLSDGKTRSGTLNGGWARILNVPKGKVEITFGYPNAEKDLPGVRQELSDLIDQYLNELKQQSAKLDAALGSEPLAMQGLILTGAFFDGLFSTAKDAGETIGQLATDLRDEVKVKLNEWKDTDVKTEILEKVEQRKDELTAFLAEVDDARLEAENALKKGYVNPLKKELENLVSYGHDRASEAYAYGQSKLGKLQQAYDRYVILIEDSEIKQLLINLPERYYDSLPKVVVAQEAGGFGLSFVLGLLTGGLGAAASISVMLASKAKLVRNIANKFEEVEKLLTQKKLTLKNEASNVSDPGDNPFDHGFTKTKPKKVDEQEKKKCDFCDKPYNAKCPMANPKMNYPSDTKGSGSELTQSIIANPNNDYSKIEDHPWYFQRKQGSVNRRSLEAHHLIISESMKNPDLKEVCDQFGYNINHHKNGVLLPYYMDLACHLGVPLHRGSHKKGQSDIVDPRGTDEDVYLNYPRAVKEQVDSLLKTVKRGKSCQVSGNPRKDFLNKVSKISLKVFNKIKKYEWSISADGFDYQKNSKVGCGNVLKIGAKKSDSRCNHRNEGGEHQLQHSNGKAISKNQISILEIGS